MQRVAIVGSPGSGKSTLASKLAERIGAGHVELDAPFHQPNWEPTPVPEFRAKVAAALDAKRWVVDGNYRTVSDLVQGGADTIVFIDPQRWLVMSRVVRRSIRRVVTREHLWGTNYESARNLFSRDPERNIVIWAWQHYPKYQQRYTTALTDGTWAAKTTHHLKTKCQVHDFLASAVAQSGA